MLAPFISNLPNADGIMSKMARMLQDRLALASYKTQHGQENLRFKDVEARLETTIKRKRMLSGPDTSSSCSSSSSEHQSFSNGLASSPLTAPMFSDDIISSRNRNVARKRNFHQFTYDEMDRPKSKRSRSYSMAPPLIENARASWKSTHNLPQSSPVHSRHGSRFSTSRGPNISFASEISTIPDSPTFGHVSDEEDHRPSRHSYHASQSNIRSSPPRTPPPTHHRKTRSGANGEEGADLLLYLATSPSPANHGPRSTRLFAPSTPPSHDHNPFAASLKTTGMAGFDTPGQQFNFADFINITPSPAQGAFGNRTPGIIKTPLAAKDARRRLNFDSLVPPGGSPTVSNIGRGSSKEGLGMELGGELVS